MSERIALVLRSDYFTSVINKDIAFFDTRRTGDLRKYSCNYLCSLKAECRRRDRPRMPLIKLFNFNSRRHRNRFVHRIDVQPIPRSDRCFDRLHDPPWLVHVLLWRKNETNSKRHLQQQGNNVNCG